MSITLSRRALLLGIGGLGSLALLPKSYAQGYQIKQAVLEPRPIKQPMKHFFAFDTGLYHGNKMENMQLQMGKVVKDSHNPLFIDGIDENPPKPWEPRIDNGYPNVILDQHGIYHCYYTLFVEDPSSTTVPKTQRASTPYSTKNRKTGLAYARSTDGIVWEKPALNLVEFQGSKANNLLMRNVAGTGIFYEPNDPDPQKRFKLITRKEDTLKMAVAFSADGIHFSDLMEWQQHSPKLGADCHNSVFKDSRTNQYILTSRLWANNLRVVALARSDDFIHWSPFEEILRGQGFDQQIYSMPVFEYQDIYFGLASLYKQGDRTEMDFDTLTLELYWSTNLTEWNKAVPHNNILIPSGAGREQLTQGEFDSATIFASPMTAGNNRLYYTGGKGRHRSWRETGLGLAYLDPQKWAGMTPRNREKPMTFSTQAFQFHGETLKIWADIDQGGKLQVELEGQAGFELSASELTPQPDGSYTVSWHGKSLVEATKAKKCALKIYAEKSTFWGIRGEFEMDESRYWKG